MYEPLNVSEKDIAKIFCMPIKTLKTLRRKKKFSKEICFTVPNSIRIIYCLDKFKAWFESNKNEAHIDYNQQIKEVVARFNAGRKK